MKACLLRIAAKIRALWMESGLGESDVGKPIIRPLEDNDRSTSEVASDVLKRDRLCAKRAFEYGALLIRQSILAGVVGVLAGLCGVLFRYATLEARPLFFQGESLFGGVRALFFLPLVGLLIVWLYRLLKLSVYAGTNDVVESLNSCKKPSFSILLAPLVFLSSVLTILCGGSTGREGAALQFGGCVGLGVGKVFERFFHIRPCETRVAILCGMSGGFAAVFSAPLTAAVFALEIACVGIFYYPAFLPALLAALCGSSLAAACGFHRMARTISETTLTFGLTLRTVVFGVLCGLVCIFFCSTIRRMTKRAATVFSNDYSRAFCGGLCVVLATLALGTTAYNGTGCFNVDQAFIGKSDSWDFVLKTLFTAVTLGCGYKGGEIVPALAVGATFGAFVAPLLGTGAELGVPLGMVALFCGTTNCPITSLFLGVELFGFQNAPLFAIVCGVAYLTSGHAGLYRSQRVYFSKLTAKTYDPRPYDESAENA